LASEVASLKGIVQTYPRMNNLTVTYFLHKDYISPYEHMYKRCTSYTLVSQTPTEKTLINQQCIKSCILRKRILGGSLTAPRVLLLAWFL